MRLWLLFSEFDMLVLMCLESRFLIDKIPSVIIHSLSPALILLLSFLGGEGSQQSFCRDRQGEPRVFCRRCFRWFNHQQWRFRKQKCKFSSRLIPFGVIKHGWQIPKWIGIKSMRALEYHWSKWWTYYVITRVCISYHIISYHIISHIIS